MNSRRNPGTSGNTESLRTVAAPRRRAPAARRGTGPSVPGSERRDHLLRLAAELFAEKGFQATTVRQIADEAGILSGSLYHHFDSKEAIVDEVLRTFLDDLIGRYRAVLADGHDPRTALSEMIRIGFGTVETHRAAVTVMQNDWNYLRSLPGERFDYLVKTEDQVELMWLEQIRLGQELGQFRRDADPKLTYRMIRDTIWVTVRWFRSGGRLDSAEIAEHYISVLFDGLVQDGRTGGRGAVSGR
nr:TetR/AcrR family transcriptional regulator [Rhizohabitans arisaemae]